MISPWFNAYRSNDRGYQVEQCTISVAAYEHHNQITIFIQGEKIQKMYSLEAKDWDALSAFVREQRRA